MQRVKNIVGNTVVLTFLRYICVGGGVFMVDLCVFLLLVKGLSVLPEYAQACSRTVGAAVGFFGHKYFSFGSVSATESEPRRSSMGQVVGYVCIMVVGIVVSPFILQFILHIVQPYLVLAKVMTEAIMVCINFVLMKALFGFSKRSASTL